MDIPGEKLIAAVQRRSELWDTTCDMYKDKFRKKKTWIQVCRELFEDFDYKNRADRLFIEKAVITKWRTIRDGYVRGKKKIEEECRLGITGRRSRPYVYADHLHFLDKVIQKRVDEDTLEEEEWDGTEAGSVTSADCVPHILQLAETKLTAVSGKRKRDSGQDSSNFDFQYEDYSSSTNEVNTGTSSHFTPVEEDDHFSFFKSLLPSVRKLNESQLFEFRIQTMQILQRMLVTPDASQSSCFELQ